MKIKIFNNASEDIVNNWLGENPEISIDHIVQSSENRQVDISIFYTEYKKPNPRIDNEEIIIGG